MSKNYNILLTSALIVFLLFIKSEVKAQDNRNDTLQVYAFVVDGDTIPGGRLLDVEVHTRMHARWRQYWAEWTRLRNAVYVTYPYAKAAGKVFNEVNSMLVNVTDKQERKRIIKSREKELKKEFTSKITNLSVYQGKVLMKLIYRETGNNCYHLIQEYKGGFTAGFYQTVAIVFGSNLKQNYDPVDKDQVIEIIVKDVARMYGHRS
ncbi:DUF4294 domain-containing protein [Segetibacter sp.]|jgi:hypothetical protein|uniref:DUF4294 domain-containing protein n=1 Tax=Segetibacter sp. TaxID=2231182 RepID=UPI0026309EFF|nr:DUF4294 domain-containing protein [Segetibacter sp.]MCW3081727.1 hypothetical protein [Segetibacter sp.]